jgi:amidase
VFVDHDLDTPEAYMNAPVAIQVVGRTLEEEAVIGMSEIVDTALKTKVVESDLQPRS